jgi:hypothetical protein
VTLASSERALARRLTDEDRRLRAILEKTWQSRVVRFARKHGWAVVSFHASSMGSKPDGTPIFATAISGDARGFPDLSLYKAGFAPIYAELKRELGKTSPEQDVWLERLRDCGCMAFVWRPSDWPTIEAWLK